MGYEIHIEREPAFTLAEWETAVQSTQGMRLDASGASATNPKTGQVIKVRGKKGDAQVFVGERWLPVFRWNNGEVSFRAGPDFDKLDNPIWQIARELAKKLNAQVVGDEGEEYE